MKDLNYDAFNIAIGHHSIECLDSREHDRFVNTLADCGVDIYLSGHIHKPNATFDVNNVNDLLFVSCGSGMCDGFSTVGFITGTLDLETGNGSITLHKWSQKLEKWIKDNEVSRTTSDNIMHISIKKPIKSEGLRKTVVTEGYPTAINIPDINVNDFILQLLAKNSLTTLQLIIL